MIKVEIKIPEHVVITADDDGVTIDRKGLRSALNRGGTGATKVPYYAISSVTYKNPGLTRGNFGIVTNAGGAHNGGFGGLDPVFRNSAYGKQGAVVFGRKHKDEILKLKEFIEQNIQKAHTQPQQQTDTAGEIAKFKKLLDDGTITQEEFDAKKKQLLGL